MGKRKSFLIADEVFKTKTHLQTHIKEILHRYNDGESLSCADFAFMSDVLKHHPDADRKFGCGLAGMYVRQNPVYTHTRNFWIIRKDGSHTDFSYLECLKESAHEQRFTKACRASIEPFTRKFKDAFFASLPEAYCPVTGERITFVSSHVDHKTPKSFKSLVSQFIAEMSIDVSAVVIVGEHDNIFQESFADKDLEKAWVEFHNANADLWVVSRKANLSVLKKQQAS